MTVELSVRAGVCTGPGPCDASPLGEGKNWVTKTDPKEGLGKYVHAIAHALRRERGLSEADSIATAIAAIKRWAAGEGHVTEATRARARAAVAHWEALKAASHARSGSRSVAQDNDAYRHGVADRLTAKPKLTAEQYRAGHPDADADDYPLYEAGYAADRSDLHMELTKTRALEAICRLDAVLGREAATSASHGQRDVSGVAEWANSGPPTPDASGSAALLPVGPPRKVAAEVETSIEHHRFRGTDLSSCQMCGRPISSEVHRRPKVVTAGERHAGRGHAAVPTGHIKGDTQRRAVAAKAAHDRSAASLEGPLEEQLRRFFADQRTSTLTRLNGKRGKQMLKRAGVRASQPPSSSPGGGGAPVRPGAPPLSGVAAPAALGGGVTAAALSAGTVSAAALAGALGLSVAALATALGYQTVSELAEALAAGSVTYAVLRATFPAKMTAPEFGAASTGSGAAEPSAESTGVDPSAIFDRDYWNGRLASVLRPYYESAASQAAANVHQHLEQPGSVDDAGSLASARQLLEARGNQTSPRINDDTYAQIVRELQAGVAAGEGQSGLAERVNAVFDQADRVRAQRIAQTEVQAALNGAANSYAESLGPDRVASKRWLAHWPPTGGTDPRTRDAHRLAAGQTVPTGSPFYVGGYPMHYPGDPAAPPELTVNCVVEGTEVIWSGVLRGLYRRPFEGTVYELVTSEGSLTVTPHHPILTATGWVAAQALQVGDKLAASFIGQRGSQPDVEDTPTSVEELYRTVRQTWPEARVGGSGVNFHGDMPDGQVDVVRPEGELWDDIEALPSEIIHQAVLLGTSLGERSLSDASCLDRSVYSVLGDECHLGFRPPASGLCRDGERPTLLGRQPSHPDGVRFGSVPNPQAEPFQASDHRAPGDPEFDRHRQDAHIGVIELTELQEIHRRAFRGHVFNLQTEQGWYVSNGIVSHNCRCAVMFLPPGADGGLLSFAAKNIHKAAAEQLGVSLSPEAAEFVG